ncbi:MAG: hypothetical protein ACUVX8_14515 [Candidatus Zipacnadales bacterium]
MPLEGFDEPIEIAGCTVHSGDLVHADKPGVYLVPPKMVPHRAEACRAMEELERPLVQFIWSDDFSPQRFLLLRQQFDEAFADKTKQFRLE